MNLLPEVEEYFLQQENEIYKGMMFVMRGYCLGENEYKAEIVRMSLDGVTEIVSFGKGSCLECAVRMCVELWARSISIEIFGHINKRDKGEE